MTNGPELWAKILEQFPKGAIVAGGAVRDWFLGIEPKDIDVFITAEQANPPPPSCVPGDWSTVLESMPDPRFGLDRIDAIYERKEEYEALNDICLVSSGSVLGYKVDAVELSTNPIPEEIVASFDFGINQCWFDGQHTYDTPNAFNDRYTKFITLHHFDRLERSRARFERLNERHGGVYVLIGGGLASPWPNEDPRYPPNHPLSQEKNEAARRNGMQIPKSKLENT